MFFCWLIEGLSYPHSTFPDGVAYLDIAQACLRGAWNALVNGYWSPGYPFLLSCWFFIFKPSAVHELVAAHVFNCIILLAALFCLEYFLDGIDLFLNVHAGVTEHVPLPMWAFRAMGYTVFFFSSLLLTRPSLDTPDNLVVARSVYSPFSWRAASHRQRGRRLATLRYAGRLPRRRYMSKAIMFPMTFCFLAVSSFAGMNFRRGFGRSVMALVVFLLVSAPFWIALARDKGRLTFAIPDQSPMRNMLTACLYIIIGKACRPALERQNIQLEKFSTHPKFSNLQHRYKARTRHGMTPPIGTAVFGRHFDWARSSRPFVTVLINISNFSQEWDVSSAVYWRSFYSNLVPRISSSNFERVSCCGCRLSRA
jgi:hypothetical protein